MGIFGFGVLRDRFTSVVPHSTIARMGYVACFDVTPIVVYAIRHSTNENEFVELFRRRMESSKEVRFLRTNPPYALCYTLDNRAPLAKRQTQIQRLLDARPLVARLATTTTLKCSDDDNNGSSDVRGVAVTPLRIKDVVARIREILLRDFVLTVTLPRRRIRHRDGDSYNSSGGGGGYSGSNSSSSVTTTKRSKIIGGRRREDIGHNCDGVKDIATTTVPSLPPTTTTTTTTTTTFARTNRIEFDYDEGEGEIKAINWLSEYCGNGRLRLIMARDNDVFVYILSKLRNDCRAVSPTSPPLPWRQQPKISTKKILGSWRLRGGSSEEESDGNGSSDNVVVEPDSIVMYHEGSNDVLLCWKHLSAYYDKCWILLLWMSVCFGNDFTFGILDKSVTSVSYYYSLLERHFINVNESFATLNNNFDDYENNGKNIVAVTAAAAASTDTETIISHLTKAFCELRNVLRGGRGATTVAIAAVTTNTGSSGGDDELSSSADDEDYGDDDKKKKNYDDEYLRLWIARQLWSFFYILELPNEFTKNQKFRICPTLRINASFDKPFMSHESFVRLRDVDFRRHIESVILYGL